jgi:3-oxoacyl-[acyl-carrier protein] reductase
VSGASRGIGRAVALELAGLGVSVVALGRDADALDRLRREAQPGGDGTFVTRTTDVRRPTEVRRAVAWTRRKLGGIDLLACCAGVYAEQPLESVTDADWERTVGTNLSGTFNLCRAVAPVMREQRSGHIVAIGSVASLRGWAETAAYTASKFGVLGLMDSLDEELRPHGIRVTTICPGPTDTDMTADWPLSSRQRKELLRPEDVAAAVVWAATQPAHVAVGLVVLRPRAVMPYSGFVRVPRSARPRIGSTDEP